MRFFEDLRRVYCGNFELAKIRARPSRLHEKFDFEDEAVEAQIEFRKQFEGIASESALGVAECFTRFGAKPEIGKSVHKRAETRDCGAVEIPRGDGDFFGVCAGEVEEFFNAFKRVLSVGVER